MTTAVVFLGGVLASGYAIAALLFLRSWRDTRDRLFLFFSAAFFLLALQRVMLTFADLDEGIYVIRLAAFVLILVAIADKNRR